MRSSGDLDAKRERYLRQQLELGGAEVILPPRGERRVAAGHQPGAPAQETLETVPPATSDVPNVPVPEPGKWRKGAPPIPGPGMTVHPPTSGALVAELNPIETLDAVAAHIAGCRRCQLCETRTNTVPGEGNPQATLMLVGEGPGETEDQTGRPFVGRAGQLLDQMLAAIDCPRSSVFIANIVKCRPPGNRKPLPEESAACLPYLHRQIALVRPRVLLALGGTAADALLGGKQTLGSMRLQVHRYGTTPLIVTYHPAALLRNPNWKKLAWDDVRIARQLLDQHD
mgnify:CR=1 FL=1